MPSASLCCRYLKSAVLSIDVHQLTLAVEYVLLPPSLLGTSLTTLLHNAVEYGEETLTPTPAVLQ